MKTLRVAVISLLAVGLIFSFAFAAKHLPEERGKTLFNDPKAFGGTKACSECHPNGRGLEKAGEKKEFTIMGKSQKSLEEAVNFCIVGASKGKPVDMKSGLMMDMTAYIKSLKMGEKVPEKKGGY